MEDRCARSRRSGQRWENYQKIASTANIEFEEADFLKGQPEHRVKRADAYFLRHILHDWPWVKYDIYIMANNQMLAEIDDHKLFHQLRDMHKIFDAVA